jgi:hypothetical protein
MRESLERALAARVRIEREKEEKRRTEWVPKLQKGEWWFLYGPAPAAA